MYVVSTALMDWCVRFAAMVRTIDLNLTIMGSLFCNSICFENGPVGVAELETEAEAYNTQEDENNTIGPM